MTCYDGVESKIRMFTVYLEVVSSVSLPAVPTGLSRLEIQVIPVHQEVLVYLVDPQVQSDPLYLPLLGVQVLLDDQVDLEYQVHLQDRAHQWGLVVQQLLAPPQAQLDLVLPAIETLHLSYS